MDSDIPDRPLRKGWTTGTCATAAAAAAYEALLTERFPDSVCVTLPRGGETVQALSRTELADGAATAGVIKDAGDDPDVSHGAMVLATVRKSPAGSGVSFHAGEGVGTVTLPGLQVPVGEPAINPGPREMIRRAIADVAERFDGGGDVSVTVAIPGGAALAERTLNARLGIEGGLSILGTTGIVQPYSCASWIHSIHRGIDVARAAGLDHLAAATGSTSEAAVKALYGFSDQALLDMGDFTGGTLKYLRAHPVARLTIASGFAKIAKLAQGALYLHSSKSQVDIGALALLLESLGATPERIAQAEAATSAAQVLTLADDAGCPLADLVARRAREVAMATLAGGTAVEVLIFNRQGTLIGRACD